MSLRGVHEHFDEGLRHRVLDGRRLDRWAHLCRLAAGSGSSPTRHPTTSRPRRPAPSRCPSGSGEFFTAPEPAPPTGAPSVCSSASRRALEPRPRC